MLQGSKAETTVEGQSCTHGYLDEPFERFGEMQGEKCRFYFKWYVLLFYLTYHPFFEAGYSVSPNTEV